jgi:hypothetical protein
VRGHLESDKETGGTTMIDENKKLENLWYDTSNNKVDWFKFQDRLRECVDAGEIKNFKCLFCGKMGMEHHRA